MKAVYDTMYMKDVEGCVIVLRGYLGVIPVALRVLDGDGGHARGRLPRAQLRHGAVLRRRRRLNGSKALEGGEEGLLFD